MKHATAYSDLDAPEDPYRDFEPTDEEVKARAAYLTPLLAKSRKDAGDILATVNGTPGWEAFALALFDGEVCDAGMKAKGLMVRAVKDEAWRLAYGELWREIRDANDYAILSRIGAIDAFTWLRARAA